jgi:O-antigen ligase
MWPPPSSTVPLEWWRPPVARSGRPQPSSADAEAAPDGRLAFNALVVFTIILVGAPQEYVPVLGPLRIALMSALVALVAHLGGGGLRLHRRIPLEVLLALSLLLLAVITTPLAIWPGGSMAELTDRFLKSVVIFWLLGRVVSTVGRLERIAWTLAIVNIPIALTALWHFAAGDFASGRIVGYQSGVAGNPNDLALTLALAIPLTAALALSTARPVLRAFAWAMLAMSAAAIVATFSRGGLLTLVTEMALLTGVLIRHRAGHVVGGLVAAGLVGMLLLPSGYGDRVLTIFDINADPTASAQDRWRDTVAATHYMLNHPIIGAGLGGDILALNQVRGAKWLNVHNAFLNYGVDLGALGLVLFVALVIAAYVSASRAERRARAHQQQRLALLAAGVRISLAGFMVAAFFYPIAYHFTFYYFAGLAVALKGMTHRFG